MVFPVFMYGYESWTIKKTESQRVDAFELWCWRRLLRDPWTCKEIQPFNPTGNQPWILIGSTDAETEAPIPWPLVAKNWLTLEKTLMLVEIEGRREGDDRGWDGWIASLTWWTWVLASSRSWWWTGKPVMLQSMESQRVGHDWTTELNRTSA